MTDRLRAEDLPPPGASIHAISCFAVTLWQQWEYPQYQAACDRTFRSRTKRMWPFPARRESIPSPCRAALDWFYAKLAQMPPPDPQRLAVEIFFLRDLLLREQRFRNWTSHELTPAEEAMWTELLEAIRERVRMRRRLIDSHRQSTCSQ